MESKTVKNDETSFQVSIYVGLCACVRVKLKQNLRKVIQAIHALRH